MRPELDDTALAASEPASAPASVPDPTQPPTTRDPARTETLHRGSSDPAPATGATLAAGRQLGHFRIERPLGAGGMGEVYLATDLALDRPVAIKVLPAAQSGDAGRRDRLVREARAQARVSHPNVAHIYFVGEEQGLLFFAMEYVAGETLAERVARGPLAVDDALAVIRAAALGLREAQRHGFTHRDIKPSNLMLDGHGVTKVLDFGLASTRPDDRARDEGDAAAAGPVAQTTLGGTPLYMAPEQARGEPIDERADIYALGATLFHLVSAEPPFVADSVEELRTKHETALRPTVPRRGVSRIQVGAIDSLCARMMAARPADRFASYDELLRAIELASNTHTRPAGFWARTVATSIDFVLAVAIGALLGQLFKLVGAPDRDTLYELSVFVLYQIIAVGRWGRTLGKALLELEVVDIETSQRPAWRIAVARGGGYMVVAMFGVLAVMALRAVFSNDSLYADGQYLAVAIPAGLGLLAWASWRTTGKRTLWDIVSRTMVRYRMSSPGRPGGVL